MNKVILLLIFSILTTTSMAQKKIKQTAGRDQLGTFAPKISQNLMTTFFLEKCGAAPSNSVFVTAV